MGSVPTSLGDWIHSPWFDLGLVVWKGYRPRVRLVLAGGHASAWISPFWRGPAPGAQRYQALLLFAMELIGNQRLRSGQLVLSAGGPNERLATKDATITVVESSARSIA